MQTADQILSEYSPDTRGREVLQWRLAILPIAGLTAFAAYTVFRMTEARSMKDPVFFAGVMVVLLGLAALAFFWDRRALLFTIGAIETKGLRHLMKVDPEAAAQIERWRRLRRSELTRADCRVVEAYLRSKPDLAKTVEEAVYGPPKPLSPAMQHLDRKGKAVVAAIARSVATPSLERATERERQRHFLVYSVVLTVLVTTAACALPADLGRNLGFLLFLALVIPAHDVDKRPWQTALFMAWGAVLAVGAVAVIYSRHPGVLPKATSTMTHVVGVLCVMAAVGLWLAAKKWVLAPQKDLPVSPE